MLLLLLWQIAPVFHKLVIKVGTKEESFMVYNYFISIAWVSGLKMSSNVLSSKPWWKPVTPAIQYLAGAAHWLVKPVNSRPMPEPLQWDTDDHYNHWSRRQIRCIALFSGWREGKRYNINYVIDGVLVLVIYSNLEEGGTRDSGEGGFKGP